MLAKRIIFDPEDRGRNFLRNVYIFTISHDIVFQRTDRRAGRNVIH
jgi:hypothetical protein